MRIPERLPTLPQQRKTTAQNRNSGGTDASRSGLTQAGCCAQICTPLGCHCIAEAPFC